ncbi:MAG: DNA replication/repair protein RecF [Proteobacteria bacterium]|nr:DNA replication/repair protein RecF [Pseudomonadota bacterium]
MSLDWLQANRFRNIHQTTLEPSPGLNLLLGENGSGKTSLLECCYFLSSARSFRSSILDPVVQRGEEETLVLGRVRRENRINRIGIARDRRGQRQIHINDEKVLKASELARLLPTLVLGPDSVDLLLGPPAQRRKFLNWGLFHVEPGFAALWESANRCLRQRNLLLREGSNDNRVKESWSRQLALISEDIHAARCRYLADFEPIFTTAVQQLAGMDQVVFEYYRGWTRDRQLLEIYGQDRESDEKRGFTQRGFHRADVRITVEGQPAVRVCSRGELKAIVWALILAQGQVLNQHLDDRALYLVDDLASEFDQTHRQRVCRYLINTDAQVLMTGVDREVLEKACEGSYDRMFHVKHGTVSNFEVPQ